MTTVPTQQWHDEKDVIIIMTMRQDKKGDRQFLDVKMKISSSKVEEIIIVWLVLVVSKIYDGRGSSISSVNVRCVGARSITFDVSFC